MTKVDKALFGRALVRISRVTYACDLTSVSGRTIPLGVIADLRIQDWYGLGLRARVSLSDDEAKHVGRLMRDVVREPFKLLHADYTNILEADDPASTFLSLVSAVPTSLAFSALVETTHKIPAAIAKNAGDEEHLRSFLREILVDAMVDSYAKLVAAAPPKSSEDIALRPAA